MAASRDALGDAAAVRLTLGQQHGSERLGHLALARAGRAVEQVGMRGPATRPQGRREHRPGVRVLIESGQRRFRALGGHGRPC